MRTRSASYALGSGGEILQWLTLGALPGIQDSETDRLASVGGEVAADPFGGETVTLNSTSGDEMEPKTLVWKFVEARLPEIPWLQIQTRGVYLFVDPDGQPVQNAVAYLYCGLESAEDQRMTIRFSGGEPIRVWFNGEVVSTEGRKNSRNEWNLKPFPLEFKKGLNRLLIRLDNQRGDEFFTARLRSESGTSAQGLTVVLRETADAPLHNHRLLAQDWEALVAEIPSVPPSLDEEFFGANLSRTMTLLETGGQTRRPVRILFYGQSITCQEWVWFLIRRLRERYPGATIEAENWAISGWPIPRLWRTIKHDILSKRPDLVVMHAYQGNSWEWERIIQNIRRETTAEIMIRSSHIRREQEALRPIPEDDTESVLLRRLAHTYGCEFVEGRKEWLQYMRMHDLPGQELRSDGIHLNRKGCVLMAQLFERHFRRHPAGRPWFGTVRRYEAMRPMAEWRHDEVRLSGDGWSDRQVCYLVSTGTNDSLRLRFEGTRLDLVMPPHNGRARVLIDGRPLSQWNLFSGSRPGRRGDAPAELLTYAMGANMLAESWSLDFTQISGDYRTFRYRLRGSATGPDGEGDSGTRFVSNSGRITINPDDFAWERKFIALRKTATGGSEWQEPKDDVGLHWSVRSDYGDLVSGVPLRRGERAGDRYSVPYRYITIADGLPPGEHELTLEPLPQQHPFGAFAIEAVEVHRPPLRP